MIPDEAFRIFARGRYKNCESAVLGHFLVGFYCDGLESIVATAASVARGIGYHRANVGDALFFLVADGCLEKDGDAYRLGSRFANLKSVAHAQQGCPTCCARATTQPDPVAHAQRTGVDSVAHAQQEARDEASAYRNAGAGVILSKKKNEVLSATETREAEAERLASEVRGIVAKHKLGSKVLAEAMAEQARNHFLRDRYSAELIKAEINAVGMTTKYGNKWPVFVASNLSKARPDPVAASPAVATPVPPYLKRAVPPGPQGLRPKPQPRVSPDANRKSR